MKTICPTCGNQNAVDPEKIPDTGAKVKCPQCQARFIIKKKLKPGLQNAETLCPNCGSECRGHDTECRDCGMNVVYVDAKTAAPEKEKLVAKEPMPPPQSVKKDTAGTSPADAKIIKFLATAELFKNIAPQDIAGIAACLKEKKAAEDDVIFRESESGTDLYILRTGTVQISIKPKEDSEEEESVQLIGPGDIFGEFAFIDILDRSATARAQEESHFLVYSRRDFDGLCETNPSLALAITRNIARIIATKARRTTRMWRDSESQ